MSQKLIEAFEKLKALDAVVPDCDGAVILNLCSDESYSFTLNVWGADVAHAGDDGFFTTKCQKDLETWGWAEDVDALVEKLNALAERKSPRCSKCYWVLYDGWRCINPYCKVKRARRIMLSNSEARALIEAQAKSKS